jgi:hypothetical protein
MNGRIFNLSIFGNKPAAPGSVAQSGYYQDLYRQYNPYVLLAHVINMVAIIACFYAKFRNIPENYVFVSPVAKLHWTNYALLLANHTENKCSLPIGIPAKQFPDFRDHAVYDFTGKYSVGYDKGGVEFHVVWAVFSFFLLSVLFQFAHHAYILADPRMLRVLHYIEYAFSSTLMIMVMGVNVGIVELFAVTGLCAAFFGMNMLGAAADGMSHFVGHIPGELRDTFISLIWLFHWAAWGLFFLAMVPIWVQLNVAIRCSDGGTPGFLIAAVVVESVCFFLFGFLQNASLLEKINDCRRGYRPGPDIEILFRYDCLHALLSLLAKTLLAWVLMGPAVSVRL